jgi:hypothetical protein
VPHRGLHKVPFTAVPINVKKIRAVGLSDPSSAAKDGSKPLLGILVSGGMWIAPSISIAARLRARAVRGNKICSSSILSVACPTVKTASQLQDVHRHRRLDSKETAPKLIDTEDSTPDNIKESQAARVC